MLPVTFEARETLAHSGGPFQQRLGHACSFGLFTHSSSVHDDPGQRASAPSVLPKNIKPIMVAVKINLVNIVLLPPRLPMRFVFIMSGTPATNVRAQHAADHVARRLRQ